MSQNVLLSAQDDYEDDYEDNDDDYGYTNTHFALISCLKCCSLPKMSCCKLPIE